MERVSSVTLPRDLEAKTRGLQLCVAVPKVSRGHYTHSHAYAILSRHFRLIDSASDMAALAIEQVTPAVVPTVARRRGEASPFSRRDVGFTPASKFRSEYTKAKAVRRKICAHGHEPAEEMRA